MTTHYSSDFIPNRDLITELDILTNFVSIEHLQQVWHIDRGRSLLRTPGPVPFGTFICCTCWDHSFSWTCGNLSGLCTSNIPWYFLDFVLSSFSIFIFTSAICICNAWPMSSFLKGDSLWYRRCAISRSLILLKSHALCIILRSFPAYPFGCKLFNATRLFIKISTTYSNAFFLFILKCRPVYMIEVTLNASNKVDICSIASKYHMFMYDRLNNIYTQNIESYFFFCVWEVVHNRTFWRTLISDYT